MGWLLEHEKLFRSLLMRIMQLMLLSRNTFDHGGLWRSIRAFKAIKNLYGYKVAVRVLPNGLEGGAR